MVFFFFNKWLLKVAKEATIMGALDENSLKCEDFIRKSP